MDDTDPSQVLLQGLLRLGSRLRHERPAGALSATKLGVLAHLRRTGPSTPGAIAQAEHQQPQSLTRVFAELEEDGLLTRRASERDRRAAVLDLTDAGRRALADDMARRAERLDALMAPLTGTERQLLLLAGRLMTALADAPER